MAEATWGRVAELFDRAAALPAPARSAFLEAACADDAGLRRQLDALLVAHDTLAQRDGDRSGDAFLAGLDPVRATALLDGVEGEPAAIGRYDVVRRLGRGGMGVVYLGRDPELDRPVAIKRLPALFSDDDGAARCLLHEARAASSLDHPNIGTIYEVAREPDGRPYIAMAYYDGATLRERLARGPLAGDDTVRIAAQVADGLAAAHAAGMVHGDIKPENLIATSGGLAKILDFGVARAMDGSAAGRGASGGTVAYMSPEQTRGEAIDGRSDVWSLGVVMYEMLTGARPFTGQGAALAAAIRDAPHSPVGTVRPDVTPELAAVVERCLAKDPARRFGSAAELATALRAANPGPAARAGTSATAVPLAVDGPVSGGPAAPRAGAGAPPIGGEAAWRRWLAPAMSALAAWVGYRIVAWLTPAVGLPGWAPDAALALLALGLLAVLATAYAQHARSAALRRRLTWRRALVAGVLAFALLGLGAAGHAGLRSVGAGPLATLLARGIIGEDDAVVLADFAADGPDARIGRVVTAALRIDLLQSPALRLAGGDDVAAGLRRMGLDPAIGLTGPAARELALRDGYKAVIEGEVGALGGGYLLTARVVAAGDGATLAAVRATARDSAGLIDSVDRLSKDLRERIGESLRALHAAEPLPRVATASVPALRRYAEATALARAGGDDARIAALLEDAVALDSTFAAAHRALATTYWNMRADRARTVEATRAAHRLRHRLPDRERFHTEAVYHWHLEGDAGRTAEAYRRVLALDPDHGAARVNLGLALLFDGEPVEAERVLRPGLQPGAPAAFPLNLARALYFQGRSDAALAVVDSLARADEGSGARSGGSAALAAGILRARVLGGDGRWEEAEAAAEAVLARAGDEPAVAAEAQRTLWHLALTRGRLREADDRFAELAAGLERVGALDALARALAQRADARRTLLGDPDGARADLHALLDRPDLDVLTAGATLAPRVAAALAAAGDTAGAARLARRWEALPPEDRADPDTFSPELTRGLVELAAGRPDRAADRLGRAADGTIQAIHYLPALALAHERAGRPDSAIAVLERYLDFRHIRRVHRVPGHLAPALLRLAGLRERTGDVRGAIDAYARLLDLWRDADPELQSTVDYALGRIGALEARVD